MSVKFSSSYPSLPCFDFLGDTEVHCQLLLKRCFGSGWSELWSLQEESCTLFRRNQHLTDLADISKKVGSLWQLCVSGLCLETRSAEFFSPWIYSQQITPLSVLEMTIVVQLVKSHMVEGVFFSLIKFSELQTLWNTKVSAQWRIYSRMKKVSALVCKIKHGGRIFLFILRMKCRF
jgi:hypothetical protein